MKTRLLSTICVSVLGTISCANAGPIFDPGTPLPDAVYSGSIQVTANGYICQGGSCTPTGGPLTQSILGPGTTPLGEMAPLISDGSVGGSIPAGNNNPGASASGSVTVSNALSPSINMNATATTVDANGATASFNLNPTLSYSMEICPTGGCSTGGLTTGVSVSVNASGGLNYSSAPPGTYFINMLSELLVKGSSSTIISDSAQITNYLSTSSTGFTDTKTYNGGFNLNTLYTVTLTAQLFGDMTGNPAKGDGRTGGGTMTMSGFVDPQFTVVGNNGDFIIFSPDIGTAPLPTALPLFASGLGLMGFLAKRRKRRNVSAIAA
jgi:hypothetical protein